jgi:hypothetical protein
MENNLACKLSTPEFRKRRATIIAHLQSQIIATEELANGYRFSLTANDETIDEVSAFLKTERECCEFFSFSVSLPSGSATLQLEMTGPSGTKEFIRNDLGL